MNDTPVPATDDPTSILETAATASQQVAEKKQIAARRAGRDAANAWLTTAAIIVRSVLPTAHRLVVDTASWLGERGENRPDIIEVFDRENKQLYDCYEESDTHDVMNEACTPLDHALRYADPWTIDEWEGRETQYGPKYDVTLPDLTPELEATCRQLAAEGAKDEPMAGANPITPTDIDRNPAEREKGGLGRGSTP